MPPTHHSKPLFLLLGKDIAWRMVSSGQQFEDTSKCSNQPCYLPCQFNLRFSTAVDANPLQLFIPAGRIYGLTDTIPFHIQLAGYGCTLKELFSESVLLDRVVSVDSGKTVASKKVPNMKPLLRVYLLRQISVTMRGESSWKNSVIGEGTINPMPPELTSCCSSTDSCQVEHIDWEGEVRCGSDITVGGFNAANVQVKVSRCLSMSIGRKRLTWSLSLTGLYRFNNITAQSSLVSSSWNAS